MQAGMACFGQGIFYKGEIRLIRFRDIEVGLRQGLYCERREQLPDFPQLALIAGGDDDFVKH